MSRREDANVPWRDQEAGQEPEDRAEPIRPGAVERGETLDTIKRRPAKGSLNFGGATGSAEGPSGGDPNNPQTAEETDADTPQPAPTGRDLADA